MTQGLIQIDRYEEKWMLGWRRKKSAKDRSKDQANTDRGYSLMELLIAMSIVIIAASLSRTWVTSQFPKWRLNGATRQVVSDLRGARMQAATQGNRHRVIFLDDHHYSILDDENNNGKPDPGELLVMRGIQSDFADVTLTSTNNPIFHSRGTASNLGTVTLKNSFGAKKISIGITGRVKVRSSVDH
jgi:prepilin-type N-terminal cleavage/methylation domain-containing protein